MKFHGWSSSMKSDQISRWEDDKSHDKWTIDIIDIN
jgi:hypothetical protein